MIGKCAQICMRCIQVLVHILLTLSDRLLSEKLNFLSKTIADIYISIEIDKELKKHTHTHI